MCGKLTSDREDATYLYIGFNENDVFARLNLRKRRKNKLLLQGPFGQIPINIIHLYYCNNVIVIVQEKNNSIQPNSLYVRYY